MSKKEAVNKTAKTSDALQLTQAERTTGKHIIKSTTLSSHWLSLLCHVIAFRFMHHHISRSQRGIPIMETQTRCSYQIKTFVLFADTISKDNVQNPCQSEGRTMNLNETVIPNAAVDKDDLSSIKRTTVDHTYPANHTLNPPAGCTMNLIETVGLNATGNSVDCTMNPSGTVNHPF